MSNKVHVGQYLQRRKFLRPSSPRTLIRPTESEEEEALRKLTASPREKEKIEAGLQEMYTMVPPALTQEEIMSDVLMTPEERIEAGAALGRQREQVPEDVRQYRERLLDEELAASEAQRLAMEDAIQQEALSDLEESLRVATKGDRWLEALRKKEIQKAAKKLEKIREETREGRLSPRQEASQIADFVKSAHQSVNRLQVHKKKLAR